MGTASRSSAPERTGVPNSRGQTTPTTVLVAVATVCLGVSLYATVLAGAAPATDRDLASPTLERVHDVLAPAGVAIPGRLKPATAAGPAGYAVNLTLAAAGQRWTAGPTPPTTATREGRRVAVWTNATAVRTGRLRVAVWR